MPPPRLQPALRHGERKRREILSAAVDLGSAEGLEGLTIGRLASEIGMSKSGLFAHFGSKEELFQAVLTRRLDPMNQERIQLLARYEREAGGRPPSG